LLAVVLVPPVALPRAVPFDWRPFAALDALRPLFRAGAFPDVAARFVDAAFLTLRLGELSLPFGEVRPAELGDFRPRAVLEVFLEEAARDVPLALRLAMVVSFRNLDSLAISVVLSDAYRKSAVRCRASADRNCGPPAPAIPLPAGARSRPGLARSIE
jgi:hypothetical protein